ncbi:MAG TPA: hypothetical protein VFI11_03880 [Anaerolineales bacterium]|nr:hypothetical protein [Anaerolineales bacterium]
MDPTTVAILIMVVLGILLASVNALPMLVLAFWPTQIRSAFDDVALRRLTANENLSLRSQLDALRQMGFTMLGVKVERQPLWGRSYREVDLASTPLQTYATIVLHPDSSPASFYCYTPLRDGGMVFTRDFEQGMEAEGPRISVRNVVSANLSEVVQDHVSRVQSMQQRGLLPVVGASQQSRLDATRAFYESDYARALRPGLRTPAIRRFVVLLVLFLALAVSAILLPRAG